VDLADPGDSYGYSFPMFFGGFDAEIAAKNGYELRVDGNGDQYISPKANAAGDMTGTHYLPREVDKTGDIVEHLTSAELDGDVTANGIVEGDCGASAIFFDSNSQSSGYSTSYSFNKPGGTYEHTWRVTGSSSLSTKTYNLDGLAPFGGAGWVSGQKFFSQTGFVRTIKVTTGVAYGVLGWVCFSGNPTASR